ncbi:type III PLP-dependent enzyme [Halobacillus fulvus]|nr:type III PLP-dependent enzyme [Halobacillus fulvus]
MIIDEKRQTIERYIEEHRTKSQEPFCAYLYDLEDLRRHASSIKKSLPDFVDLYYAVKANPEQPILETLEPIVDGFEVASAGEMNKVSSLTVKPMMFGGPAKKDSELEEAIRSGVKTINVESFHELNRLAALAEKHHTKIPVLARVNLTANVSDSHLRMSGVPTQFGVDEQEIPDFIKKVNTMDSIDLRGFHFHAMSNNLDAEAHLRFVEACLDKSLAWAERYRLDAPIVNIGGGIGINYWHPDDPFDWQVLAKGLHDLESKTNGRHIFMEIGRYMTASCGVYAAEVLDVKQNHDQSFAVLRGGSHHLRLPAAWKMSHPFRVFPVEDWPYPFERPEVRNREVTIAGELCTPNDVLVRQEPVTRLRAGDVVLFEYAGAYAWTISHHDFLSHPHPEIVYING